MYGEPQYVITSYNWYPIYIFKEGKWYIVSESYSSSTGKQIGQTRIYKNTTYMTAKEMAELRRGKDVSEIFKGKQENLTSELKKLLMGRQYQFATVYIAPPILKKIFQEVSTKLNFLLIL